MMLNKVSQGIYKLDSAVSCFLLNLSMMPPSYKKYILFYVNVIGLVVLH